MTTATHLHPIIEDLDITPGSFIEPTHWLQDTPLCEAGYRHGNISLKPEIVQRIFGRYVTEMLVTRTRAPEWFLESIRRRPHGFEMEDDIKVERPRVYVDMNNFGRDRLPSMMMHGYIGGFNGLYYAPRGDTVSQVVSGGQNREFGYGESVPATIKALLAMVIPPQDGSTEHGPLPLYVRNERDEYTALSYRGDGTGFYNPTDSSPISHQHRQGVSLGHSSRSEISSMEEGLTT